MSGPDAADDPTLELKEHIDRINKRLGEYEAELNAWAIKVEILDEPPSLLGFKRFSQGFRLTWNGEPASDAKFQDKMKACDSFEKFKKRYQQFIEVLTLRARGIQ